MLINPPTQPFKSVTAQESSKENGDELLSAATNLLLVDNVPKTTANRQCYLRANDMFFQVIA